MGSERRYYPGLDLARGLLMLGGPLVHSSYMHADLAAIPLLSSLFRMPAFFAISGYLGAVTIGDGWLRRRMIQIGVPLLFGLLVLAPIQGALTGEAQGLSVFWFLAALLVYMPLASALRDRLGLFRSPVVTVGVAVVCGLASAALLHGYLAAGIIACAPFYAMGWAFGRSGAVPARAVGVALPVCVLLWLLLRLATDQGVATRILTRAVVAVVNAEAAWLILGVALHLRRAPTWAKSLAGASFTIYMLHALVIFVVMRLVHLPAVPMMLTAATASLLVGYAFHVYVVRRSATAAFLLNGRRY